jgi:hypothetical protein
MILTEANNEVSGGDALDRGKVDASPTEEGVYNLFENRDHDDDREWVQILNNIIGRA